MAGRRRAGPERGPKARLKESFMPLPALRAAWPFLRYVCAEKRPRHGCGPIKQYNNVFGKRHDYSCRFSVQGTNILHLMPCFCLSTRNAKLSTSGSLFSSAHRLSIRVSKFADSSTALSISTSTQFSSIDYKIHAMACQEMPTPVAYHAFSHS